VTLGPLTFLQWIALTGAVLLVVALASAHIQRLPVSTSIIYLGLGVLLGPHALGWLVIDLEASASWLGHLTEIAIVFALFVGGLRLRLPLRHRAWRAAYGLAGPVMLASIALVALAAHTLFGLDVATSLLLGAVLAPTDPVLASTVSVNDARDRDRMRYALSGEAGLNDGMAFPFVVLALEWARRGGPGAWLGGWAAHRLLWAVPAALIVGFLIGKHVGRYAIGLRHRHRDAKAPSDFLALALVAFAYVGAEAIGAWGFLAVFAAGVGLRRAEALTVHESPHPDAGNEAHPPAEHMVAALTEGDALEQPAVAAGVAVAEVISFGDTVERLLEVLLMVLVGALLLDHFDVRGIAIALLLFVVIRPAATFAFISRSTTSPAQRALLGWFGVRGIGSLYYLAYALGHGLTGDAARDVASWTVMVVAASVVLHGVSAAHILARYEASLARQTRPSRREERPMGNGPPDG
jgi:NhaP-type Na+/H+ or K+/H+ antiporter